MLAAVLLISAAGAMTWWIQAPAEEVVLAAALESLWPEEDATIRLVQEPDALGVHLVSGELTWLTAVSQRRQAGIGDWPTAVVLVRSWSDRLTLTQRPPEPVLIEAPELSERPPSPQPPDERAWHFAAVAGPASRRPVPGPAFHFSGQVGLGRRWQVPLILDFDPSERALMSQEQIAALSGYEAGVVVRRLGALLGVARMIPTPRNRDLELSLSGGVRSHRYFLANSTEDGGALVLPTAAARIRVWNVIPPRVGLGLMVSTDSLGGAQYTGTDWAISARPLTIAVEVGGRREEKP